MMSCKKDIQDTQVQFLQNLLLMVYMYFHLKYKFLLSLSKVFIRKNTCREIVGCVYVFSATQKILNDVIFFFLNSILYAQASIKQRYHRPMKELGYKNVFCVFVSLWLSIVPAVKVCDATGAQ